ncbi:hypothetical protein TRFO_10747 [Tritrichomonas foetus]|uniref:Uncharacterized protein n=1 Tax=Tritrichomonas foetus TaxID=1144522 RepID=A0A1J4J9Y4_9EUKA|nr:hypothetical protein TRFO_10747 [Tritrichomonas foetus]|eukprot:OHS95031.1 hypothetical protein TRFO_10747 [Tritrichomonas foetus]
MTEESLDYNKIWTDTVTKISGTCEDIPAALNEPFTLLNSISIESHVNWISAAFACWANFANEQIIQQFFALFIAEYSKFLLTDISDLARLNNFLSAVATGLESPHRVLFIQEYAAVFPSYFPDPNSIDLNFLLALQSPVFSYCVNRHPDSSTIYQLWFDSLASSQGAEIFRDNHQLAVSYFKIMNHAFFQISVTTTPGAQQEDLFVVAQKAMKSAIVAVTRKISE